MLRGLAEKLLRRRYAYALVVAGLGVLMVTNELIFQNSSARLRDGIQLSNLRWQASRLLQLVTDAETGMRGYLLTGREAYLQPYRVALDQMPPVQEQTYSLIEQIDLGKSISLDKVRAALSAKLGEMRAAVELYKRGSQDEALSLVESDVGMARMNELRANFDEVLSTAITMQLAARTSLYDAMRLNRWAVHLLSLIAGLGLYVFMGQLQQTDQMRQLEKQRLAREVELRTAELRDLAGHLVRVREDERGRLARELHDELGGLFTAMKLEFARVRRQANLPVGVLERLQSIERRLNDGITFKRRMVENLRPSALDQLGLVTSVSLLCRDSAQDTGLVIEEALEPVSAPPDVELTLYRLVQESLTNVTKYAQAKRVQVMLRSEGDTVVAEVCDDGCGFDLARVGAGHHGLVGMRFRVESHHGTMTVDTAPGQGTRIAVRLPLVADEAPPGGAGGAPVAPGTATESASPGGTAAA